LLFELDDLIDELISIDYDLVFTVRESDDFEIFAFEKDAEFVH